MVAPWGAGFAQAVDEMRRDRTECVRLGGERQFMVRAEQMIGALLQQRVGLLQSAEGPDQRDGQQRAADHQRRERL